MNKREGPGMDNPGGHENKPKHLLNGVKAYKCFGLPNYSLADMRTVDAIRMPRNTGILYGPHLIITECVLCGLVHHHGACADPRHSVGDITTRVPHCRERGRYWSGNYAIEIVSEVDTKPKLSRRRIVRDMGRPPMIDIMISQVGL